MYFFPIHLPGPQNERWLLPPPTGNTSRTSEKPLAPLLAFSLDCVYRPGAAKLFVYLPDGMAFSSPPYSCISAWPEGSPYFFHSRILAPFIAWGGQLLKPLANQPCPHPSWGGVNNQHWCFRWKWQCFPPVFWTEVWRSESEEWFAAQAPIWDLGDVTFSGPGWCFSVGTQTMLSSDSIAIIAPVLTMEREAEDSKPAQSTVFRTKPAAGWWVLPFGGLQCLTVMMGPEVFVFSLYTPSHSLFF